MIPTDADVGEFVARVSNVVRRRDAETLLALMQRVTGQSPRLWGSNIVGFGEYHYRYATGREGDAPAVGFSPRAPSTTVYVAGGAAQFDAELAALGEHTTGVGCLYLQNLERVDLGVLESVIARAYAEATAPGFGQTH